MNPVDAERARLKRAWPDAFHDGERCAFQRFKGERGPGGYYPKDFGSWAPEKRDAWWGGYNLGRLEREAALMELADG